MLYPSQATLRLTINTPSGTAATDLTVPHYDCGLFITAATALVHAAVASTAMLETFDTAGILGHEVISTHTITLPLYNALDNPVPGVKTTATMLPLDTTDAPLPDNCVGTFVVTVTEHGSIRFGFSTPTHEPCMFYSDASAFLADLPEWCEHEALDATELRYLDLAHWHHRHPGAPSL